MEKHCIFCLKINPESHKLLDVNVYDAIRVVFPNKSCNNLVNPVICVGCLSGLNQAYNFSTSANRNYRKEYSSTTGKNWCQMCLKHMEKADILRLDHIIHVVPYYKIKTMLDCLSLELEQYPVICSTCWYTLNKSYHFITACLKNEKKVVRSMKLGEFVNPCNFLEFKNIASQEDTSKHGGSEVNNNATRIKIETDCQSKIKEEPADEEDDIFCEKCTKENCSSQTNTALNCATVKEESIEKSIGRDLYVDLEKLDFRKIIHRKDKDRANIFQCRSCSYATWKKYRYDRHQLTHSTSKENTESNVLYKCHNCAYVTKIKCALRRHLKVVHRLDESHISETCTKDAYPSVKNNLDLKNIILKCGQCEFETRNLRSLVLHKNSHGSMKLEKIYKCELCSYQVKKKSSIDRHLGTHFSKKQLSNKLYACYQCHYKSKRKDSLTVHIQKKHIEKKS